MPVLTDVLAERIDKLAERIDKLVDAIAESNKAAARLEERVDRSLSVAKWAVGLLTVVVIACAPAGFGVYRDVALLQRDVTSLQRDVTSLQRDVTLLKQSVDRIEAKIDRLGQRDPSRVEAPRR